jgi:hypothetical protein
MGVAAGYILSFAPFGGTDGNPNQIVFVETVGTNSTVAQHIAQGPH